MESSYYAMQNALRCVASGQLVRSPCRLRCGAVRLPPRPPTQPLAALPPCATLTHALPLPHHAPTPAPPQEEATVLLHDVERPMEQRLLREVFVAPPGAGAAVVSLGIVKGKQGDLAAVKVVPMSRT